MLGAMWDAGSEPLCHPCSDARELGEEPRPGCKQCWADTLRQCIGRGACRIAGSGHEGIILAGGMLATHAPVRWWLEAFVLRMVPWRWHDMRAPVRVGGCRAFQMMGRLYWQLRAAAFFLHVFAGSQ